MGRQRASQEPSEAPQSSGRQARRATVSSRGRAGKAANGAGSVVARQLKSGATVYDVFWTYQDDDGVRRRAGAYGFASSREAEKHRRAMTVTVDTGRFVAPADMTVAEYLEEWIEGQRLKPQTVAGYRRKIRIQIVPHIGRLTGMPVQRARATYARAKVWVDRVADSVLSALCPGCSLSPRRGTSEELLAGPGQMPGWRSLL